MRSHGIWRIIAGRDLPGPGVWPAWPGNSSCTNSVFFLHGEGPPIADPRCTVLCHCFGEDENTNTSQLRIVRSWRVFFRNSVLLFEQTRCPCAVTDHQSQTPRCCVHQYLCQNTARIDVDFLLVQSCMSAKKIFVFQTREAALGEQDGSSAAIEGRNFSFGDNP